MYSLISSLASKYESFDSNLCDLGQFENILQGLRGVQFSTGGSPSQEGLQSFAKKVAESPESFLRSIPFLVQ